MKRKEFLMIYKALIIVDVQNDFLPGGSLAVPQGDEIIGIINKLLDKNQDKKLFSLVIASQDWHPENHESFKTTWPVHCVQHSHGAELAQNLYKTKINKIIYKGTDSDIDSYSVFFDNEHKQKTELDQYLKEHKITDVYIVGLATDYCVKYSVLDALSQGYKTYLIEDVCRGINLQPDDVQKAIEDMKNQGVVIVQSSSFLGDKGTFRK